jgi:hypothetical protein
MAFLANIVSKLKGEYTGDTPNPFTSMSSDHAPHFEKLYDYYVGDKAAILKWMHKAMSIQFKYESLQRMQFPYLNMVHKIIDRTALAYNVPPLRYLDTEGADEAYQEILAGSNINQRAKSWGRFAKLLDTVYVGVIWRKDHIEYDILPPHMLRVVVNPDNFLIADKLSFSIILPDGTVGAVVWTPTENYVVDEYGKRLASPENPDGKNPYGVIPYLPCRLRMVENHWGEGDSGLVDLVEKSNIMLVSTFHNGIMQSHGQAVAINLGGTRGKGDASEDVILTGPDTIIEANDVRKDVVQPDFFYAQPQPAIEPCLKQIDFMLKMAAVERGLPAESVSFDVTAQSGAAKSIDNQELMEVRQSDIEALRAFEKSLFEVTREVWNYHGKPGIPESAVFGIDFDEPKVQLSEKEELEVKEKKYPLGLWTPVDDVIDEDEGIDEKAAVELIRHNLEIKKELSAINAPEIDPNKQNLPDDKEMMNGL